MGLAGSDDAGDLRGTLLGRDGREEREPVRVVEHELRVHELPLHRSCDDAGPRDAERDRRSLVPDALGKVEDPAIGDDEEADLAVMSCLGCRLDAFTLDQEQRHEPPFDRSRALAQPGGDQLVDRPRVAFVHADGIGAIAVRL